MTIKCQFCDNDFDTFVARVNKVTLYEDFCSQFCEDNALQAQRMFDIALPCFHEFKQPVTATISQFGFKDSREEFKALVAAMSR